jgi:hypothetical protein
VVAAESLEHVPADIQAIQELVQGAPPGGTMAITCPAGCPRSSAGSCPREYHDTRAATSASTPTRSFATKAENAGLELTARATRTACTRVLVAEVRRGVDNDTNPAVKAYHRLLVWDIMKRPRTTRIAERLLDPVIGKSLVLYFRKPS